MEKRISRTVKSYSKCLVWGMIMVVLACLGDSGWPPPGFSEGEADQNTTFPDTVATDVKVLDPLPVWFPEHPCECDSTHFLRIRHVKGPVNPSDADRILIAQPGILEGAAAFYNVAANLVTRAYNERGKFVEFWAVDRRPNCLEDLNGLRLARSTGNLHDMIDYYYRNKPYKGRHFAGYLNPLTDAAWLAEMGMEQTVKDWNAIITRGIPDQSVRQKKVYLGGHSLGAFIVGAYAGWDFDGNPLTTDDAGYNQCAGFFGLEAPITADSMVKTMSGLAMDLNALLGPIPDGVVDLMRMGLFERFVSVPGVMDPEIMSLLTGLGYAAAVKPKEESDLIAYLPASLSVSLSYRFYHSRTLDDLLASDPTITKFRYTNQALLAVFTDNNSMPLSIVNAGLGFFTGGSIGDKEFPFSTTGLEEMIAQYPSLSSMTAMLSKGPLVIATDAGSGDIKGPLYGWLNYNELDGAAIPSDSTGKPYTGPDKEVTDINDFARSVGALPMDFTEKFFPIRLAMDCMLGMDVAYKNGVSMRPVIDIMGSDGANMGNNNYPPGTPFVPGYHHLDVLTAAPVQNDGQPEKVTTNLLNFIFNQ